MSEKDFIRRADHNRFTADRFFRVVGTFPEKAQEYISSLSSGLLEQDIREGLIQDAKKRGDIQNSLRGTGLSSKEVGFVFKFFGLPIQTSEEINKK